MSSSVSDVLSWEEFYKFSKKRKEYPPKQIDLFNRLIGHTKNFFLISAYGAFSPGYVMLITKELMPSMSMVKDSNLEELKWLISKTKKAIEETYSRDVVYFEHGMCACVGGLDRAHLHFMSVKKNTDKDSYKKIINKVLHKRRAGISAIEIKGHKLDNIHDITHIMDSPSKDEYKIHGKQLKYNDIISDIEIDNWPVSTRKHTRKGGHYVFFNTGDKKSSFLTDKNFQTQLGRQIVFELELESNGKMIKFNENEINKNSYSNIWKWQEFPFKDNMLNTMENLIPSLLKLQESENKFSFKTFIKDE